MEDVGLGSGRLGAAAARDSTSTLISVSCSSVAAAASSVGATACTDAFTPCVDTSKLVYFVGMAASVGGGGLSADNRCGDGDGDGDGGGGGGDGSEAGGAQENTRTSVWPTVDQCSTILNQSQPWSDPPQNPWRRSEYLCT